MIFVEALMKKSTFKKNCYEHVQNKYIIKLIIENCDIIVFVIRNYLDSKINLFYHRGHKTSINDYFKTKIHAQ